MDGVNHVVEVKDHSFTGDDGKPVIGKYFYFSGGNGSKRLFVSNDRLKDFVYVPKKGDDVYCFFGGRDGSTLVDFLKA